MVKFLTRLQRWRNGWLSTAATVSSPRPVLSDLNYENALIALLDAAEQGKSWGALQGMLILHNLSPLLLAQWLREKRSSLLEQPEQNQDFARRLLTLAQVASGELATIADAIGSQIQSNDISSFASAESYSSSAISPDVVGKKEEGVGENGVTVDEVWQIAITQHEAGNYEAAIAYYGKAIKMQPDLYQAWFNQGNALIALERYEAALASFKQALKLNPNFYQAWSNQGNVLAVLGHHREALASLEQALKHNSSDALIWDNRGLELSILGHQKDALTSFEQALILKPDFYKAWFNWGNTVGALGRHEEALASYEQTLKLNPDDNLAWYSRGLALSKLSRNKEALVSYEQALKLNPDDNPTWINRGALLIGLGHYEEAIASFEQALKLDPVDSQAWENRGSMLANLGLHEEGIASFEQALKLQPDNFHIWDNRGRAASNSNHYSPFLQQQFAQYFSRSCAQISQRIRFSPPSAAEAQASLQASWQASQQLLLETFRSPEVPETLLEVIQRPLPPVMAELLQQPSPPALLELLRQPPSNAVLNRIHQDSLHQPSLINLQLQQRGYLGELASYQAELGKAIKRETHPKGWGVLHHRIGQAHAHQARRTANPTSLWRQAEQSFKTALQVLQPPQFEELHLEVIQDLVQVLIDLEETAEATELQRRSTDFLQRLLNDPQRSARQRQQLALKFAGFGQLTVTLALHQGDITRALSLAETSKNTCLRWLLGTDEVPKVHYDDMQSLCNTATTVLVYWHLSPISLTTFLLLPNSQAPIVIVPPVELPAGYESAPEITDQADERSASLRQLLAWEKWLKGWNQDYADYSSPKDKKGGNLSPAWKKAHPWRTNMAQRLADLKVILNGSAIEQKLAEQGIEQIILIPHRDLHRFPLHHLFDAYSCTYFPCAHLALARHRRRSPAIFPNSLLLVENPKSTFQSGKTQKPLEPLPFAETESVLIQQWVSSAASDPQPTVTVVASQDATLATVTTALEKPHQILHFTGHGAYDRLNPSQSCLFLAGSDRLTLSEIVQLDLSAYHLVCLAACETAVTGDQTITDEYVGLMSAFLKAGVRHVLSTLWRVESVTSMMMMVQFYRELHHQPPVIALRAAQTFLRHGTREQFVDWLADAIALLSTNPANRSFCILLTAERDRLQSLEEEYPYAHPYYWAAFHIAGAV